MADLVRKDDQLAKKLSSSLESGSLKALVQERKAEKETHLLLDYSSSMDGGVFYGSQTRKIDALRKIADDLRADTTCPQVGFGGSAYDGSNNIRFIERVPEPAGGTPLAEGIDFCAQHGAKRIVVVSDGEPDDPQAALASAKAFGGVVDIVYVGPEGGPGAVFMKKLAEATKGRVQVTTLRDTKQLTGQLRGLLGTGTPQLSEGKKPIIL